MLLIRVFTASLSHLSSFEWWILIIFPWNVRIDQDPIWAPQAPAAAVPTCLLTPVPLRKQHPMAENKTMLLFVSFSWLYIDSLCVCVWINQLKPHPFPSPQLMPAPHLPPPKPSPEMCCISFRHLRNREPCRFHTCTFIHACTQAALEMMLVLLKGLLVKRTWQRTGSRFICDH